MHPGFRKVEGGAMNLLVLTNNPRRPSFYLDSMRVNGIESEVAAFPDGIAARLKLFRRAADFDVVFLHKKRLNLIEAPVLHRYARRIIYDFDDAVMYRTEAPNRGSLSDWVRFRLTIKLADLVIAGNSYLAEHALKYNRNVEVVPTGLETKEYTGASKPKDDGKVRLVWIGPALEEVGSRFDNVSLRMICDDFFDLQNMPVEKMAWSQETQAEGLAASEIGLAPLPDNRFTRGKCGFKILQYASAGLPVVASPVGVNADYVRDNVSGLHASNTAEWVEKISYLVENAQVRTQMGAEALKWVEPFDASVIGERLAVLIRRCAGGLKS